MVPPYAYDASSNMYTNLNGATDWAAGPYFAGDTVGTPWVNVSHMLENDLPWGECFTCFTAGAAQVLLAPVGYLTGEPHGSQETRYLHSCGLLPRGQPTSASIGACPTYSSDGFMPVIGTPVTWKQVLDRAPRRLAENNAQLLASVNKTAAYFKQIANFDWTALYGMNQDLGYPLQGCNNHTPAGIQPAPPVQEPGHMRAALHAQGLL